MTTVKVVLAVAAVVLFPTAAMASDPHEEAVAISKEIMSPFCPGITLHDCPSRAALDLRDQIEEWVRAGWSRDRVLAELVAEYGESVLAVPDGPLTPVSRLLPVAAIGAGGLLVWRLINRWQRRPEALPVVQSATAAERAVLDAELDGLRRSQ